MDPELIAPLMSQQPRRLRRSAWVVAAGVVIGAWPAAPARAQTEPPLRLTVPTLVVTAQKEPEDKQKVPLSVTAVPKATIESAGITTVSEAGVYAPNTFYSEFQARKLSFPHFRGVSSGPGNPAITTYVDGVPHLHTNASSVELLDVEQVEFVRGAQSGLFGRNALGGIVNVSSSRPSLSKWSGQVTVPFGNFSAWDLRGSAAGPLTDKMAISLSAGRSQRDGFTTNDIGGHRLDDRSSSFGKAQLYWLPADRWEARVIVSGERAKDGDYALNDLAALRSNPFHAARDFEGHTDRDILSVTAIARREGAKVTMSTTTGVVRWHTFDETDLDYTPLPLFTRRNAEDALQFTQEVRLASAVNAPVRLSDTSTLRWQGGVFFFTQGYQQDAVNAFSPYVLSPFVAFPVTQHSPQSTLDDLGVGVYGQGTVTLGERLDVTLGARVDHERKNATLHTFYAPVIAAPTLIVADRSFSSVSPQLSMAYRVQPERMLYVSVGRGFKAGGFNPASPAGSEAFGEEHAWQLEGGAKTAWASGRVTTNLAAFRINWNDLQLNLPNPNVPAQFYIANVASATSSGVELDINARPREGFDLFGVVGYTRARFGDGSVSSGIDVSGNTLPSTPGYTATVGGQYSHPLSSSASFYGRAEATRYGAFHYDDANTAGQEAYSLTHLRAGVKGRRLSGELWVRNAFDARYIPIAFAYPGLAPSGFVAEMGRPRTFGLGIGVTF